MAILHPTPVPTDRFNFAAGVLSAEASDLGLGHGRDFGQVYDDACDVGLTLVSHRTGRELVFAIEREERDREGDVQCWHLSPVGPPRSPGSYGRMTDAERNLVVRIWND